MYKRNKILVYDLGIVKNKKKNYKNNNFSRYDYILTESSKIGTKVFSNKSIEGFYYINEKLNKNDDYEFSFTWVDGNNISPIIQIRETKNMDVLTSFLKKPDNQWGIYTNSKIVENEGIVDFEGFKSFKKCPIHQYDKIRLVKKGKNVKIYCSNKLVIDYDVNLNSDFYIGFGGHLMANRYTIFKELILKKI